ncbi:asparagine synthase (glutamine-hydrolyzing) [Polynucleobacter sp. JS-Mosq-20-D10]|uniref:asparagine synthase (glutamine-hydrolyzing) n=1 Tax=Polynucleobacter sp. JS-Mosq-20-D10 TaxID=2576922 RepID=UPI001BFDD68D|nr:asparagine synthase (glutamine-hydrolyzing) [Polynucleobacter sp. JS-Mosq-20-D10]QWE00795.1 asparagine synthase (glutamine-hydrolyzing) [Polynucleobacter sp. JS-Mosq-20-D10]
MCGIVGYLSPNQEPHAKIIDLMLQKIQHRGPDGSGIWLDKHAGIILGHQRLSILDLSSTGAQPMKSQSGRFIIVFNGEIYNHLKLRDEMLRGGSGTPEWRGSSDTETLLAGFEFWGIEATLAKAVGMFAFALWDSKLNKLILARDRFGEKPLYYGWQGGVGNRIFLFGSDLSALRVHPAFSAEISRDNLALFMRYGYIGGEHSIYKGINKLKPGCILKISLSSLKLEISNWWSTELLISSNSNFRGDKEDAVKELESLLANSIRQQMLSDVPVGAFLSGGVDSTTIVSMMQAQSSSPIKTFTVGFYEDGYNEAEHAKKIAKYLGTDHTELYVNSRQALDVIQMLPTIYSEPFADASQIPTYLVSGLAGKQVKVALSGDGGDELFCGYTRYQMTKRYWNKVKFLPIPIRILLKQSIYSIPISAWDSFGRKINFPRFGDKLYKAANLLDKKNASELYGGIVSLWDKPNNLVIGSFEPKCSDMEAILSLENIGEIDRMMALDLVGYLPEDILTKVDRAAMSVSLETRVPLLDHRIVEFAWSLPLEYKINKGVDKWPLRKILYKYVPQELIDRPKMGFGIPLASWLRGPLKNWAEELLNEKKLDREGYLNSRVVRRAWSEHLSGKRNWAYQLWNILMFQMWLES